MMSVSAKSISWCTLRRGLMRRLGATDSRLYYFLSNLTRNFYAQLHGAWRMKANTGAPSGLHTVDSLAGSKTGMVTTLRIFLALTLGWVGAAQSGRNQIRRAPEYRV
jgi:hypothetical protein